MGIFRQATLGRTSPRSTRNRTRAALRPVAGGSWGCVSWPMRALAWSTIHHGHDGSRGAPVVARVLSVHEDGVRALAQRVKRGLAQGGGHALGGAVEAAVLGG